MITKVSLQKLSDLEATTLLVEKLQNANLEVPEYYLNFLKTRFQLSDIYFFHISSVNFLARLTIPIMKGAFHPLAPWNTLSYSLFSSMMLCSP